MIVEGRLRGWVSLSFSDVVLGPSQMHRVRHVKGILRWLEDGLTSVIEGKNMRCYVGVLAISWHFRDMAGLSRCQCACHDDPAATPRARSRSGRAATRVRIPSGCPRSDSRVHEFDERRRMLWARVGVVEHRVPPHPPRRCAVDRRAARITQRQHLAFHDLRA